MLTKIRAVLFDIGGVLIRTDDPGPRLTLARRWGLDRAGIDRVVFGSQAAQAAEQGEGDEAAIWDSARQALNFPLEDLPSFQAAFWAGDILDVSLLELLRLLHQSCRTGLLTNSWLRDPLTLFTARYDIPREQMAAILDVVVSSAQLGVRKPDRRIFLYALEQLGTQPEETLFVDDFPQNIAASRELGMEGILFENPAQVRRDIIARMSL